MMPPFVLSIIEELNCVAAYGAVIPFTATFLSFVEYVVERRAIESVVSFD